MIQDKLVQLGIKFVDKVEYKTTCPNCYKIGKTHVNDLCLSVNTVKCVYKCHKCSWVGFFGEKRDNTKFISPNTSKIKGLTQKGIDFLINRGFTLDIIKKHRIYSNHADTDVIFPYFLDGKLVNFKSRNIQDKKFHQSAGGLQVVYNYDNVIGCNEIIITESEEDCMAVDMSGFHNVVSVSQGAPNPNDKNIDKKLECLNNSSDVFESVEKIIICVDDDPNGHRLRDEIIRRFGAEICVIVDMPSGCKDARDVNLLLGLGKLKEIIELAKPVKIEGVFSLEDAEISLLEQYDFGLKEGTTTYFNEIDAHWRWRPGEVTLWTGYNNEGKSTFLSQLSLIKSIHDDWKFAFFSPENMPIDNFYRDLIEMYTGKTMKKDVQTRMSKDELIQALEFLKDRFFVIYPEENFTIESILNRVKYLIKKHGIRVFTLDPYNTITHIANSGEARDQYAGRFMSMMEAFAKKYQICLNIVAHQVTTKKDLKSGNYPKPYKSNIREGGILSDKADNVVYVWRENYGSDPDDTSVTFGSDKIRFQKLTGKPGSVQMMYNWKKSRYYINLRNPLEENDYNRNDNIQVYFEPSSKFDEQSEINF